MTELEKEAVTEEELRKIPCPHDDAVEVTGNQKYGGGSLARLKAEDLRILLAGRIDH
jgi:hypothetical protein